MFIVLAVGATMGCTHNDGQLEKRVTELEREVAALRASATPAPVLAEHDHRPRCPDELDDSVAPGTVFSHDVSFEIGATDLPPGDSIRILQVLGTASTFEVGGVYRVRGEYTLQSADDARIALTVSATEPGFGCTHGNGSNVAHVVRGTGTFEVSSPILYEGNPHVYFTGLPSKTTGVYFGRGAFLRK